MSAHSIIAPSSAKEWVPCPGSAPMSARFPSEYTAAANEGLCTHGVGGDLLEKPGTREKYVGHYKLYGVLVTDEIFNGAKLYADEVNSIANFQAHVEERISAPQIHIESFGTCDAWYYHPGTMTLYIWDLKYGFKSVDAFECWQLINYASGILSKPGCPPVLKVVFVIVQPRDYSYRGKVKKWEIATNELAPYFERMRAAAESAFSPNPIIKTGSHCQYCRARHACDACQLMALDSFEYSSQAVPRLLDPIQLGRELQILSRAKEAIDYRYTGLEKQIEALIKKGENIPQWEIRNKTSRKEWTLSIDELKTIAKQYETNLTKEIAITPKQAIELGFPVEVAEVLTQTKPGKRYLVPYNANEIARKFKNG